MRLPLSRDRLDTRLMVGPGLGAAMGLYPAHGLARRVLRKVRHALVGTRIARRSAAPVADLGGICAYLGVEAESIMARRSRPGRRTIAVASAGSLGSCSRSVASPTPGFAARRRCSSTSASTGAPVRPRAQVGGQMGRSLPDRHRGSRGRGPASTARARRSLRAVPGAGPRRAVGRFGRAWRPRAVERRGRPGPARAARLGVLPLWRGATPRPHPLRANTGQHCARDIARRRGGHADRARIGGVAVPGGARARPEGRA